jgi:nucleoside-diphosphate-sugar epimerase
MRVLVTGATGFIGYETARLMAEQGHEVRALVRRPDRAALLTPFAVTRVVGDLDSADSLRRACEDIEVVLHLAARATFEQLSLIRPTIVEGSASLLAAAADAGVRHLVYASSFGVYGDQAQGEIDAGTPTRPVVDYGRAKVAAEERLRALAAERGTALAILRLPHVYGARDLMFERLRGRAAVFPGLRAEAYAHLHVHDAARALAAVAEQGWTGTAPIGDGENAGWDHFFAMLRRYYPHHRAIRVPAALALPVASLLEPVLRARGGPQMITADTVRFATLRQPARAGLVWEDLGLVPRYPTVAEGIPASLDEFVAYRWKHPVDDRAA